jgi:ADP-ribosylglycohydrolase
MRTIRLSRSEYRDKNRACWLGKNIGGTLGEPWECKKHALDLTFYHPVPDKAAPNDDLDLQLVWLEALEKEGVDPSVRTLASYWERYASVYPWNEYGFFMRNYRRGLRPPMAGCFENYFVDEMGSPIRSEIWACLHPANPQAAARMAWKDSAIDHAGGEGTHGEMFWAAAESAAFVEKDIMTLIRIGLNAIPISCRISRSIREAIWCYENGLTWGEARERILTRFANFQPCDAIANHGFMIIGLLYGQDFGDRLCKAVNCGFDTDCTGATVGAFLGIIHGTAGVPEKWLAPIGEEIVPHPYTGDFDIPKTVDELTDRTMALAEQTAESGPVQFADETSLPEDLYARLFDNRLACEALAQNPMAAVELLADGREVWFHYDGDPVVRQGLPKRVRVEVENTDPAKISLLAPDGWHCMKNEPGRFIIQPGRIKDLNRVQVRIDAENIPFVLLGPGQAKGFPAGDNVPACPVCKGLPEACACQASAAN